MTTISQPVFDFLKTIAWRGVQPGLERMQRALAALGNPQKSLRVIHIAGTNGKGSVCTLTAELLAMSGYSVGLSLSPHIHDWRERIQYYPPPHPNPLPALGHPPPKGGGQGEGMAHFISENDLLHTHQTLLTQLGSDMGLTYFEWSILLALSYFSAQKFDFVVLETGLGGRWDATNVCDSFLSGIVTVGLDHMAILGDTLSKILSEKQCVIKADSDFLFGPTDSQLTAQVHEYCVSVGARFHTQAELQLTPAEQARVEKLFLHKPSYYKNNFLFVLALARILQTRGIRLSVDSFLAVEIPLFPPARCEQISTQPLIVIDGAHNEPALNVLKSFAEQEWHDVYDLVFGCLNDRNVMHLASLILPQSGAIYWAQFLADARGPSRKDYHQAQVQWGGDIVFLDERLKKQLQETSKPVLVCGSLYLCAQFNDFWRT